MNYTWSDRLKNTKQNRIMIVGLVIVFKVVLMGLFSSDYQDKMFMPFVDTFLAGNNPYEYFYSNGLQPSFPYFPLMLLIESIGGGILSLLNPTSVFLRNMIFKLPLLAFDIILFCVLRKLNIRFKYLIVFYFCSPIMLYATYVHGQLDIIPTTLLMVAVCYLLNWKKEHNLFVYAVFLGLALSCKAHIMAAVPILFFYVAKKKGYITAIKMHLVSLTVVTVFTAAFWGEGFINLVLLNREQMSLTSVGIDYGMVSLLIPIAVLLVMYFNVFDLNYFNKNLLITMLGILFTLFLICISPMPAWFIWVVPFYALYFCIAMEDKYKLIVVYALFNLIYLIYFVVFHITENIDIIYMGKSLQFIKINDGTMRSVVFTLMVSCLGMIAYKMYKFGLVSNNLYKRGAESFVIGIAGDSGAGKSRLMEKIKHLFGSERDILFIEGDGDHKWDRSDENWDQYTALNPQANFLYRQAEDIKRLKTGNSVFRAEYDHDTGTFTEQKRLHAKKYIVLCGLHSLYLPLLREKLDLKIFMDTDNDLRNYWKIQRDMKERGYSKEEIVQQINKRIPDAEKYIYPQKQYADVVITYFDKTLKSCYEEGHVEQLSVKFVLSINMDVENLIKTFEIYNVHPEHRICDDLYHQEIIFDGKEILGNIDFEKIAELNVPQYEDFFTYYPEWGKDVEGVIQVMLLFLISEKMKG